MVDTLRRLFCGGFNCSPKLNALLRLAVVIHMPNNSIMQLINNPH